jgi:hypothetical protein
MLHKKPYLKILANKPDIFSTLPPEVLSEQAADRLRQIPRLAVAEIAGPADTAPLRELLQHFRPEGLVPTLSYTGTEYGDWAMLGNLAASLKKTFEKELNIYVAEPVVLGSPPLWKALRHAHDGELRRRYGCACSCLGCRLYNHMLRVPLCKKIDARFFIPSVHGLAERGCPAHTSPIERKYFAYLMSGYGIDVWHQGLQHEQADDGGAVLSCALVPEAGNGMPQEKLIKYFESFAMPAAGGILSLAVFCAPVDYARIISEAAQQKKH